MGGHLGYTVAGTTHVVKNLSHHPRKMASPLSATKSSGSRTCRAGGIRSYLWKRKDLGSDYRVEADDFGRSVEDVLAMQGPSVLEYSQNGKNEGRPNGNDRDGVAIGSAHSPTVPDLGDA